jgi:hypothetical protein
MRAQSVYIPDTGLGTTSDNQFCLVKTNTDSGCSCQSEGFDFTATGFCAVLDPNDQSYRFIEVRVHNSCWLQASSSCAACRGLARRTTAERLIAGNNAMHSSPSRYLNLLQSSAWWARSCFGSARGAARCLADRGCLARADFEVRERPAVLPHRHCRAFSSSGPPAVVSQVLKAFCPLSTLEVNTLAQSPS